MSKINRGFLLFVVPCFVVMITLISCAIGFYRANLSDSRLYGCWEDPESGFMIEFREDGTLVDSLYQVPLSWTRTGRVIDVTEVYGDIFTIESSVNAERLTLVYRNTSYNLIPASNDELIKDSYSFMNSSSDNIALLEKHTGNEEVITSLISEDRSERLTFFKDGVFESSYKCDNTYKVTESGVYAMDGERFRIFRKDSLFEDVELVHGNSTYGAWMLEGTGRNLSSLLVGTFIDYRNGYKYIFGEDNSVFLQTIDGDASIYEYAVTSDKVVIYDSKESSVIDTLFVKSVDGSNAVLYSDVYEYDQVSA